jgi:hypothetical protein
MEEVIGSIPIRSTKHPNNLDNVNALGQIVCVNGLCHTPHFAVFERASIAVRFASMRTRKINRQSRQNRPNGRYLRQRCDKLLPSGALG